MNLYRIIQNAILSRREKEGRIESAQFFEPVVQLKREEVSFSSDVVVPIVEDGVLDTNNPLTVAKYKSNLQVLMKDVLSKGRIDQFRLIREDDFFPYDWKWRVNSRDTYREYAGSKIAYEIRMTEARRRLREKKQLKDNPLGFDIPFDSEEIRDEISHLPQNYGMILEPVRFRSTKHFTINLPLPYTGAYNHVLSGRNFIVIDKPDALCQSGYGYSADYGDCYVDVTHEELPISEDAIVLIQEDKYPEIMKDEEIREQLSKRRVVVYRGEEGVAINMVLSQEGVLPYQEGTRFVEYDPRLYDIMIHSMQEFCQTHHLDYRHNHGNMFGRGGHFTDLLDGENQERELFEKEFIDFLRSVLPEYNGLINDTFFKIPDKVIQAIGSVKMADAVEKYNQWAIEDQKKKRQTYDSFREDISEDNHALFVETLQMIRSYYDVHADYESSVELHQAIRKFFHANTVSEQVEAAKEVQGFLKEKANQY